MVVNPKHTKYIYRIIIKLLSVENRDIIFSENQPENIEFDYFNICNIFPEFDVNCIDDPINGEIVILDLRSLQ